MKKITYPLFCFLLLQVQFVAASTLYKCEQSDGQLAFQDTPCSHKTLQTKKLKSDTRKNEDIVSSLVGSEKKSDGVHITENEIIGQWTDLPGNDSFSRSVRSKWKFGYGKLVASSGNGVSFTHKYKLEGNVLTIHHKAIPGYKTKAWTQKIEIIGFDGKRIKLGKGGPPGQNYLYRL